MQTAPIVDFTALDELTAGTHPLLARPAARTLADTPVPGTFGQLRAGYHARTTSDCATGFELYRQLCDRYTPERAAGICWVDPNDIRAMARICCAESRPVA